MSSRTKSKTKKVVEAPVVDFVEEFNRIIPFIQKVYALKESTEEKSAEKLKSSLEKLNNGLNKLIVNEYFLSIYKDHVVSEKNVTCLNCYLDFIFLTLFLNLIKALKQVILSSIELIFESKNEEVKISLKV
jgi:hypothetical protein